MWQTISGSPRRRTTAIWTVLLLLVLLGTSVSCARHSKTTRSGTPSPTASPSVSPSPTRAGGGGGGGTAGASAAGQLADFFAAAQRVDGQLRHAAVLVNEGIGTNVITLAPSTVRQSKAIDATALVGTLPAGVDANRALLRSVMLVYSDLVSRQMAFARVWEYPDGATLPRSGPAAADLIRCLGNGGPAAARFASDLAAAKALAASSAPLPVLSASSRAAADVAVRAYYVNLANRGCGNCGGEVFTSLRNVVWTTPTEGANGRVDGTVENIPFRATYEAGHGWRVVVYAC